MSGHFFENYVKTHNSPIYKYLQAFQGQKTTQNARFGNFFFIFAAADFAPAKHNQQPPAKLLIDRPINPQTQHSKIRSICA